MTPDTGTLGTEDGETAPIVALPFNVTRKSDDVLTVSIDNVYPNWEQWFLIVTDAHWDNPHCRRDLFHRFHKQAVERRAGIIYPGDFFCAMQSRNDRRGTKAQVRPEHQVEDYFGALVDTAVKDLEPYKQNILLMSYGNHETAVLKNAEIDLLRMLTQRLGVNLGGYAGFIRFMFSRGDSNKSSIPLFYFHGAGGGGQMTLGLPDSMRRAMWVPDAAIVISGHIHSEVSVTLRRLRLSISGTVYYDEQTHVTGTSLKEEFSLQGGYHLEKGRPPKPIGSTWLRFYHDTHARGNVGYEITRAR